MPSQCVHTVRQQLLKAIFRITDKDLQYKSGMGWKALGLELQPK